MRLDQREREREREGERESCVRFVRRINRLDLGKLIRIKFMNKGEAIQTSRDQIALAEE
jgi:hypothetical protein